MVQLLSIMLCNYQSLSAVQGGNDVCLGVCEYVCVHPVTGVLRGVASESVGHSVCSG